MSDLSSRLARLSSEQRQRLRDEWRSRQNSENQAAAFPRRGQHGDFPLSFAQERLWFLDQMSPGNPFYNISSAQRIPFFVEQPALERALTTLVTRHGALRTIYPVVGGKPVQRVLPAVPVSCAVADLSIFSATRREAELQRLAEACAQQPFDLAKGPMFRAMLVRLGRSESAFIFVVHHIAADAASTDIIFRELGTLYADEASQRAPSLRDVPVQYSDFAVWQRSWLHGERLSSQVEYWRRQLANVDTLNLPTDRPRPLHQTYRGAHLDVEIPANTRRALYALANECAATPFMLLLTAFYVLLHRYSQQDDIAVGVPIANRTRRELESVVGFFANSLVLRGDMSGDPTFRETLARVRELALQAYSHQDVPFSLVVSALKPQQDLSRNPLFQVSFQLVSSTENGGSQVGGPGVRFERGTAIFDLVLNLWEQREAVRGLLEYNTDLFDRATASRMVRHYLALLESIARNPDQPISALELLTDEERRQLLVDWNDTAAPKTGLTLHALVEEQVRRNPDAVALQQGALTVTYAELDSRASALARQLLKDADDRGRHTVGVMLGASVDLIVAILGVLKSGNAYVPLDPATPVGRLSRMLDDAGVRRVITSDKLTGRLPNGCELISVDSSAWTTPHEATDLQETTSDEDVAYILFTSGSTGTPKGVVVPHRSVVNYLTWCRNVYPVSVGSGAPLCSPPWSDMSITSLFLPLISGTRVVLLDQDDVVEALDVALRGGADFSFVKVTPSHLDALRSLSLGRDAPKATAAFIVGGEALAGDTLSLWREQAPDVLVFNEYGPTEATVGCVVHALRAGDMVSGSIPIGRPIANTRLYVLGRHGELVPAGVPGELYIAGEGVALGYTGTSELADERFRPDRFSPQNGRMYRTGDLVRYSADGILQFLGRLDGQVKIRGYRVEPGDIEAAMRRHPAVADAVVTARDLGRADRRLIAHVVLTPTSQDRATVLTELREFLRRDLPAYMVPSTIAPIDALPLTSAGKVDLRVIEHLTPDQRRRDAPVPPATPLERVIATVYEEVIGVSAISVDDDFFADLGGHSLIATQAVARLRELLRFELPLRWVFEAPTVRGLASAINADPSREAEVGPLAAIVAGVLEMSNDEVRQQLASTAVHRTEEPPCA